MSASERHLSTGPLSFLFDGETGLVRNICIHEREILRGIYPAVRGRDWETFAPKLEPTEVIEGPDSVQLIIRARVTAPEVDLRWEAAITARAIGTLSYSWRATAERSCITNRTGLCVLHPAECAGVPCVVEHVDGSRTAGWFPENISPHQPFRELRAVTHAIGNRCLAEVRMEGAAYEMEDQRNWTDASFKTYARPLALPFPYVLTERSTIEQSIHLEVRGVQNPGEANERPKPPQRNPERKIKLRLGFTLPGPLPAALRDRCRSLRPAHVRVEANPANLTSTLDWAVAEAAGLNTVLLLAIRGATETPPKKSFFPDHCIVHLFSEEGNAVGNPILAAWSGAGFANLGTGTLNHFAELNRNRPPADGRHTHTVFGICPQVHLGDERSIQETLSQHASVAFAAYKIGALRPVFLSPISFGPRTGSHDPRLSTMFGARWLWESLKRLSDTPCVEAATFFDTHGPAGFLSEARVTPAEQLFQAIASAESLPHEFPLAT